MRTTIFSVAAFLMIGLTTVAQRGMDDYASVQVKPNGNSKVFVETFKTYIFNVDFIEDGTIYDEEIDQIATEFYRILSENNISYKKTTMADFFNMVDENGYISVTYKKNGIEYILTIQDTSGEVMVITEQ